MNSKKVAPQKIFVDFMLIVISSILCAWLFFFPAFWDLAPHSNSFSEGVDQIFFNSQKHSKILGGGIDHIGTIWMFSMVDAMLMGEQSTYVDLLYHPIGFDLGKNTGFAWADAWVSWPIIRWLRIPQFYHLHLLLTIAFTMGSTALLLRKCGLSILLAISLSSMTIMQPFVIKEFYEGRPTQIYLLFHVLMLYGVLSFFQRVNERKSGSKRVKKRDILVAGLGLSGACLTYWFGGTAVGFCAAVVLLLSLFTKRRIQKMIFLLGFSVVGILCTLLITWRISTKMLMGEGKSLFPALNRKPLYEIDLGIFPSIPIQNVEHLENWNAFYVLLSRTLGLTEGFLLVMLLGFGLLIWSWRQNWLWSITFVIALGIPMSSALTWDGGWFVTGHALLESVFPPLARCHVPERMVVAPILIGLVFVSTGLVEVQRKIPPIIRPIFIIVLSLIVIQQSWKERPQRSDLKFGSFLEDETLLKATKTWAGGIIDVPLFKSQQTYVQMIYHKTPILGGPGLDSVRPQKHRRYVSRNSFLRTVEGMAEKGNTRTYKETSLKQLYDDGFGILAIHENLSRTKLDVYREMCGNDGIWDARKKVLYLPLPKLKEE